MLSDDLKAPLTEKQVYEITQTLSVKQKEFLDSFTNRSRKSKWMEVLANKKGIVLEEDMSPEEAVEAVKDWVLLEVLDAGYGNKGFYHCECGAGLRFQYIVHHEPENKTYKLGETCLGNYTELSPEILKDIKKGFHSINLERDELLIKIVRHEDFVDLNSYSEIEVPKEFRHQIKCDIPLLDKQISQLDELLRELYRKERQKKEEERQKKIQELQDEYNKERQKSGFTSPSFEKETEQDNWCVSDDDITVPSFESMTDGSLEDLINMSKLNPNLEPSCTTYYELMNRHLEELKEVRKVENNIPLGLIVDWETIQTIVRNAKVGNNFNYGRFKMLLNNLKIPLGIQ